MTDKEKYQVLRNCLESGDVYIAFLDSMLESSILGEEKIAFLESKNKLLESKKDILELIKELELKGIN